jgi:hypothetical protein
MTSSAETASPPNERRLRFTQVVSVHREGDAVVVTFRDERGEERQVSFPASEEKWLLQSFVRLHGGG